MIKKPSDPLPKGTVMAKRGKVHKGLRAAKMAAISGNKPAIKEPGRKMSRHELEQTHQRAHVATQRRATKQDAIKRSTRRMKGMFE